MRSLKVESDFSPNWCLSFLVVLCMELFADIDALPASRTLFAANDLKLAQPSAKLISYRVNLAV